MKNTQEETYQQKREKWVLAQAKLIEKAVQELHCGDLIGILECAKFGVLTMSMKQVDEQMDQERQLRKMPS